MTASAFGRPPGAIGPAYRRRLTAGRLLIGAAALLGVLVGAGALWFVLAGGDQQIPALRAELAPPPRPQAAAGRGAGPGASGEPAWQAFARPFDARDKRPRIAIVVAELGLATLVTESAIRDLPEAVTLAFSPYAPRGRVAEWIEQARAAGHETLLGVPMEPFDFPRQDPGPDTLLTFLDREKNAQRLAAVLGRASGYVGIIPLMGARFLGSAGELRPVLEAVKARGLLFVDSGTAAQSAVPGLAAELAAPFAVADRLIDTDGTRAGIDRRLAELEDLARRDGVTLGLAQPYPVSIERIAAWAGSLAERDLVLAPVSAIVKEERR